MRPARLSEGCKCLVCERKCEIKENSFGVCGNYVCRGGRLYHFGWGKLSAIESRPIEIKPLFHYWPNSTALTFSGWGCNFYCPWCQNWPLSFRRPSEEDPVVPPERLLELARGDEGLCASFNEPATLFDYLLDLAPLARKEGKYLSLVTNAYFTERAVDELVKEGWDGWSVDVKGCPKARRALRTVDHSKVFRNAKRVLDSSGYVEMVYLVVTGYNEECWEWIIDMHLKHLGEEVPLHVNRYYPANLWREPPTPISLLMKIRNEARKAGIKYVYVGNVGDPDLESTYCPKCGKLLIRRVNYRVTYWGLVKEGGAWRCPRCGEKVPIKGEYVHKAI